MVEFSRFLHCEVSIFPFYSLFFGSKSLSPAHTQVAGRLSYTCLEQGEDGRYYVEFFCKKYAFLLSSLSSVICPYQYVCMYLVTQACPALCGPVDCSPPGSSVHGILQARILEWVAMASSRGPSWPGIGPASLMSPALAGGFFTTSATWEVCISVWMYFYLFYHPVIHYDLIQQHYLFIYFLPKLF